MRYTLIAGVFAAFLIAAAYAVKAEWIRDHLLNWTARTYGTTSAPFRMQKWFVDSPTYIASFRVVSAIVAIVLLGIMIYLIVVGDRYR
jgi:hypothetical protein